MSHIEKKIKGDNWIITGLVFGALLYVSSEIIIPIVKDGQIDTSNLLIGIPVAIIAGLVFGYIMKLIV